MLQTWSKNCLIFYVAKFRHQWHMYMQNVTRKMLSVFKDFCFPPFKLLFLGRKFRFQQVAKKISSILQIFYFHFLSLANSSCGMIASFAKSQNWRNQILVASLLCLKVIIEKHLNNFSRRQKSLLVFLLLFAFPHNSLYFPSHFDKTFSFFAASPKRLATFYSKNQISFPYFFLGLLTRTWKIMHSKDWLSNHFFIPYPKIII